MWYNGRFNKDSATVKPIWSIRIKFSRIHIFICWKLFTKNLEILLIVSALILIRCHADNKYASFFELKQFYANIKSNNVVFMKMFESRNSNNDESQWNTNAWYFLSSTIVWMNCCATDFQIVLLFSLLFLSYFVIYHAVIMLFGYKVK